MSPLSAMVAEEWKALSFYSNKLLKMAFAQIIFDIFFFFVKYKINENGRYQNVEHLLMMNKMKKS